MRDFDPQTNFPRRLMQLQKNLPDHLVCDKHTDQEKLARDWLDASRDEDRLDLIEELLDTKLRDKRMLEVGSGAGTFIIAASKRGVNIEGIEPVSKLVELTRDRLSHEQIDAPIAKAQGEDMPYEDKVFDIVCSFNVIEHVADPQQVINEAIRITKPGGYVFFIIPSYNSFWEGHYGIFWWPSLHKWPWLMNIYIRLMGRDPTYTKNLQFITPSLLRKIILESPYQIEAKDYGFKIWQRRLHQNLPAWGYTRKLFAAVAIARELRMLRLLELLGKRFEFHSPIILVGRRS